MNARKYGKIAYDGLITNNATFKLVLGTCATLGMSTSAVNSFGMGCEWSWKSTFPICMIPWACSFR